MKEKYQIEYLFSGVSQSLLWNSISTAPGLSQWFASKVELVGEDKSLYRFYWDKVFQEARLVNNRIGCYVRFRWVDDEDDTSKPYFEFRISVGELTNDLILTITDYAFPEDKEDSESLWNSQVANLKTICGCDNL